MVNWANVRLMPTPAPFWSSFGRIGVRGSGDEGDGNPREASAGGVIGVLSVVGGGFTTTGVVPGSIVAEGIGMGGGSGPDWDGVGVDVTAGNASD